MAINTTRSGRQLIAAVALILALGVARRAVAQRTPTAGQDSSHVPAIADIRRFLLVVADDSTMGRQTGSRGDDIAARYIAGEFRRFGLQPAGDGGTYFQAVPLRMRTYVWSSTVLRTQADTLRIGTDYVPLPLRDDRPQGPLRPLSNTLVVFGGVFADSGRLIDSASAAGRLVILALPHNASWAATRPLFREGVPKALHAAAAVALVALDVAPTGLARFTQEPQFRLPDQTRDTSESAAILLISSAAARRLLGVAADNATIGATGARVDGHIAVVDASPEFAPHNVVAVLPGSDPRLRATYVSLSAHHDHVGFNHNPVDHDSLHAYMDAYEHFRQASPELRVTSEQSASIHVNVDSLRRLRAPRLDSIYNGADDDALGIAALLAIAQRLSGSPHWPRRSVLFLAHTGEEAGLLGSTWYSEHATVPRDSIIAEMDMDMVGRGSARDLAGGGPTYLELIGSRRRSTQFGDMIDSINTAREQPFHINYAFDAHDHPEGDWCRADHYSYARFGIPVGAFSTSYHGDYHQVTDEPQYIDYAHLAAIAGFVGDLALTVANRDHRFVPDHPKPADPHAGCVQ